MPELAVAAAPPPPPAPTVTEIELPGDTPALDTSINSPPPPPPPCRDEPPPPPPTIKAAIVETPAGTVQVNVACEFTAPEFLKAM